MNKTLMDTVSFDFIRYANCWEDADILLEALQLAPGSKILSVASAGDNSFALLLKDPELLVAVDVNPVQLYLVELKRACFLHLEHEETLQLLGFKPSGWRQLLFRKIQMDLSPEALNYWNLHPELIDAGVVHQGKFERYFQLFCSKILPWIHTKETISELFTVKNSTLQDKFYQDKWNTWKWRLMFRIFFSRYMMGRFGRHPEFLKQVEVPVAKYIFSRAEEELRSKKVFDNFMVRYNLTAGFGDSLPLYLCAENYSKIRANIKNLVLHKGYAEEAITVFGKFDAMNLSNIFEYLDSDTFHKTSLNLLNGCLPQAQLAYWNLMVPRRISRVFPERLKHQEELSGTLRKKDKGFFYSDFIIEQHL